MAEHVAESVQREEVLVKDVSKKDESFDLTVEALQDILLSEEFGTTHQSFLEKNYHHFEDTEENKHVYMDIYKAYTDCVERHLEQALLERVPGFRMDQFLQALKTRNDEIDETIMDMLQSFTDFLSFKQTFLDYKKERTGQGVELCVTSSSLNTTGSER